MSSVIIGAAIGAVIGFAGSAIITYLTRYRVQQELLYERRATAYPELYLWFVQYIVAHVQVYGLQAARPEYILEVEKRFHKISPANLLFISDSIYDFFKRSLREFKKREFLEFLENASVDDMTERFQEYRGWLFRKMRKELGVGRFMKTLESSRDELPAFDINNVIVWKDDHENPMGESSDK